MNNKTTPKDFFLHLGATIALYAGAIALINLSFAVINYAIPDALASYYYSSSIAWPISMLVVLIPLLYILEWFLHKDYTAMPEKMTLWIRRWRIYLTLFLAGATIVGDLIALINTYLNGELTGRFLYKILAILIICGIIFAYYIVDRKDASKKNRKPRLTLAAVGLVVVLVAIVSGFMIVGSPAKQRAIRFDQQRINDLSNIQGQLINYWMTKGSLPTELSVLNDGLYGTAVPTDPDTKAAYEYTKKSVTSFELCSTFSLTAQDNNGRGAYYGGRDMSYPVAYPGGSGDDNWKHDAGRACFTRTIDPDRYQVNPKVPMAM